MTQASCESSVRVSALNGQWSRDGDAIAYSLSNGLSQLDLAKIVQSGGLERFCSRQQLTSRMTRFQQIENSIGSRTVAQGHGVGANEEQSASLV
ncbi:hypothetical protein [Lichenihabitans psoromatis]|uniref:hypothetical protein n=1 Tax=Lichenihabitans psoromatis TaxID=2528642 RepID=UPI0013F14E5B|nr:hypothetical protein [Lichenihabitans psoromatis]